MAKEKKKRNLKVFIPLVTIGSILGLVVVVLLSYVGYISFSYYRIGDIKLTVKNSGNQSIKVSDIGSKEFSISTYNIGFGAYERDYSFFMDKSRFKEEYQESQGQVELTGKRAHGLSKDNVIKNTNGAYKTVEKLNPDFMLYQEVDTKSTRAYKVNQHEIGNELFSTYDRIFALNYHSAFLAYPFHEPIGQSESGIGTYSKYEISEAERKEFKITDSFFGKFFDLDRAFTISQLSIEGSTKKLYIFNVHLSAYDSSGTVRSMQMVQLREAIKAARDIEGADNYVIVGGDFNHDLLIDNPLHRDEYNATIFNKQETEILTTDWYNYFRLDETKDGKEVADLITNELETYTYDFKGLNLDVHAPVNIGTVRDSSVPFADKNNNGIVDNAMVVIDGFLTSDNISVSTVETIGSGPGLQEENLLESDPRYGLGFVYSDHNPVLMNFKLNA